MNLEQKLEQAVQLVEDVKRQIEADKKLKPYKWVCSEPIYNTTQVMTYDNLKDRKKMQHKLSILSCINNLKKTLGCNWEFTEGEGNFSMLFNQGRWAGNCRHLSDVGSIVFASQQDAAKVAGYLNTHYPNGWALPAKQGEA